MLVSQKLKQEFGKNLKFNEPLKNWTTFRIGGSAKYFFIVQKIEDFVKIIKVAEKFKIKYFILGEGSNLLFSDKGFNGLIIKNKISNLEIGPVRAGQVKVIVGAGVKLTYLVMSSIKVGLTGLEWAAGIPGSVGGAIFQNAGAFGSSFAQLINKVIVFENNKVKKINKKECFFAYRSSVFQRNKNIILGVELRFKKGNKKRSQERIKQIINYRRVKQPIQPSAGSVFKNIDFKKISKKIVNKYPQLRAFKKSGIIPAGWLIENSGLKGKKIGGAQISEKHANFIINKNRATAEDVKLLICLIRGSVLLKFGVKLNKEIEYVKY
ncbi:MAG: UDP-N-acetylmuramate dehydrogenase [Ignavibacterium sp.]|nr:UDP-N-acetylmuramate dehydrogenase [Ignavibacterium sp.]